MSVKVPFIYHGMYLGEMSEDQASTILGIREAKKIDAFEHMIFDFPMELILESFETGKSVRSIIKERNIDYTQYIGELRPYQTVGTAFMYMSPRSILGDGVGLGKTAEVAALLNYLKYKGEMGRFLMAVENSALAQTATEITRFTGLRVVQLSSEAVKLRREIHNIDWSTVDGIIIKHSALRSDALSKWIAYNIKDDKCNIFDTFILDESSIIKNDTTKIYSYTSNICDLCKRVHFMNATTFETSIMDIYYQEDILYKTLLPRKSEIQRRFCTYGRSSYWTKRNGTAKLNFVNNLTGYKNQKEFKESLKLNYFGRCKADVGMERPNIYKVYEVEPTNDQGLALSKGYRYNEVLNCPSLISDLHIKTDRKNVPKIDRLMQLMENDFTDSKVMVYAFHLKAQEAIAEQMTMIGRHPVILNGSCTDEQRWEAQNGFNNGKYDVIITNIKKSLNLYSGDVCIFYSMETNASKAFQIAGRIDRNVDDSIKTFVMLLYKGTDEYKFFTTVVKQRSKDARDLTIDAKTTVDYFIESMNSDESDRSE